MQLKKMAAKVRKLQYTSRGKAKMYTKGKGSSHISVLKTK